MKQALWVAAGVMAATLAVPASAQVYVGVGAGGAKTSGFNGTTSGITTSGDGTKTSWKVLGGYQFTPEWGLEAQYADLGKRDVTASLGAVSGRVSTKANQWGLAGTATLPMSGGFSLLGKLGVSRNHVGGGNFCVGLVCAAVGGTNRTDLLAGVGVAYNFNKNLSIRGEYENFGKLSKDSGANGGSVKGDNWSLSLLYAF